LTSPSVTPETNNNLSEEVEDRSAWLARQLVLFCQLLFRDRKPGDYRWYKVLEESEIHITDQVPTPLDSIDQRPTLQLVTATQQNQNLALQHLVNLDWRTGRKTYMDMVSGQASFNCHSKNDDVARRLATIVYDGVIKQRQQLIRMAKLHFAGHVASIGPSSPPGALVNAGADVESTMVSVMFPFYFAMTWVTEPKLIPLGKRDAYMGGNAAESDEELENPSELRTVKIDARIWEPGVVSENRRELRHVGGAPISPPTIRGRNLAVIRQLDKTEEDLSKTSPRVGNVAVSEKE